MAHELLDLLNLDPNEDVQENLRLALMFKNEVDEATQAYLEMLQLTIENSHERTPEEITQIISEAIHAALLTGLRTYRSWIQTQGINVQAVEENSGKDIPLDFFHNKVHWPL